MTDFWKDDPALEARLERVVALIGETLALGGFPSSARSPARRRRDGKLLRPALLVIGSVFGRAADTAKIERLAAAIELLHVATLVHDDIIDEAPLRRGQPSLHSSLGVKRAVLAGDWLFSRCFLLASEGADPETARGLARLDRRDLLGRDLAGLGQVRVLPELPRLLPDHRGQDGGPLLAGPPRRRIRG